MKKVFIASCIFCVTLFLASCASSKKEVPQEEPPVEQEVQVQEEEAQETPAQPEQQPEPEQTPEPEQEPAPQQAPLVKEIPLPEEVEIFDEPEVEEEYEEEDYEDYPEEEEEDTDELFEVTEEEEQVLSQEEEPEPVKVPEGFTAEETEAEVQSPESVNLEELAAVTESEETPEEEAEDFSEEEIGMTDEVEVEEVFEEEIIPSRAMELLRNQYVDVIYPGSGWVYLGETDDTEVFKYVGRKTDSSHTIFTLKSTRSGSAVLHFYKNDILTGNYIDDYLEVNVDEERTFDTTHVEAPSYEELVPERLLSPAEKNEQDEEEDSSYLLQDQTQTSPSLTKAASSSAKASSSSAPASSAKQTASAQKAESSEGQTNIQKTDYGSSSNARKTASTASKEVSENAAKINSEPKPSTPQASEKYEDLTADELLSKAKKAYNAKKYSETLDYLDSFFDKAVTHVDEGLYLKGQTLETKSEVRNIKAALEAYEDLVKKFPQSNLWSKSNDRITYLKRFYFNIR